MFNQIKNFILAPLINIKSISFYKQFRGKNMLFFDVGANKGVRTKIFRKLGVKVVAVEPQSSCYVLLQKKFGNDQNVKLVHKGAGRSVGEMRLSICSDANMISTFSEDWKKGRFSNFNFDKEEVVLITTLDDLIKEFGMPDFIKIDVEGFELEVIAGLTKKVPALNFEFTSEFFDKTKDCLSILSTIGFTEFNFVDGEDLNFKLDKWINKEDLIIYLNAEIKQNSDLWGDIYAK